MKRLLARRRNIPMTQIPLQLRIQDDQIFLGRLAAHLLLDGQDGFLDLAAIDVLKESAKSRLVGHRVFALSSEIVVAAEQTVKARQLDGLHQPGLKPLQQSLFVGRGQSILAHAPNPRKFLLRRQ